MLYRCSACAVDMVAVECIISKKGGGRAVLPYFRCPKCLTNVRANKWLKARDLPQGSQAQNDDQQPLPHAPAATVIDSLRCACREWNHPHSPHRSELVKFANDLKESRKCNVKQSLIWVRMSQLIADSNADTKVDTKTKTVSTTPSNSRKKRYT